LSGVFVGLVRDLRDVDGGGMRSANGVPWRLPGVPSRWGERLSGVLNLCGDAESFCTVEGFCGVFSLSASAWRVGDRMARIGAGVMKMSTSVVLSAFNQSLLAILLVGSTWDMKGELEGSLFVSLCTVSRVAGESMSSTRYDVSLVVASRRRMRI
jgi:hypothetical protein